MNTHTDLEKIFSARGYVDYKWIAPGDIVVSQWVRMKCTFGCSNYGSNATCPPNVPSVSDCRLFFDEYKAAAIFHFEKKLENPEDRHAWTKEVNQNLLKLEKEVFISGYQKAFLLFMDSCNLCTDCAGKREECKNPKSARPTPEAMAIDVFTTVRQYGFLIEVLSDFSQTMNRYAFLLIE